LILKNYCTAPFCGIIFSLKPGGHMNKLILLLLLLPLLAYARPDDRTDRNPPSDTSSDISSDLGSENRNLRLQIRDLEDKISDLTDLVDRLTERRDHEDRDHSDRRTRLENEYLVTSNSAYILPKKETQRERISVPAGSCIKILDKIPTINGHSEIWIKVAVSPRCGSYEQYGYINPAFTNIKVRFDGFKDGIVEMPRIVRGYQYASNLAQTYTVRTIDWTKRERRPSHKFANFQPGTKMLYTRGQKYLTVSDRGIALVKVDWKFPDILSTSRRNEKGHRTVDLYIKLSDISHIGQLIVE
jgi:hypothetical protein